MAGLHVERIGQGAPLVLVHGWAMHGGIFAPLIERLRERHELHVVDLPGHGHSRGCGLAIDPAACADAIAAKVPPAVWLGWSLGGLVAMHAAHARPERVDALVALAASPRFVAGADWPHGVDAGVFQQFGAGLAADYRATVDRFLALEAQGSDHMREELRQLRADVYARGEPDPRVLAEGLDVLEYCDLRSALPALRRPSLWIAGRRDRLVSWQAMQAAAGLAPRARFVRVDGGGHAPFLTHADEVADAIEAFLAAEPA
jgi:pimeloyl-[acyl-carrier protein] methyl ester esterase